jgi:hypothetical protein
VKVVNVTEGADDADTSRRDMDVVERPRGYFESSGLTPLAASPASGAADTHAPVSVR